MTQVISNDVSAIIPEIWASTVQVNLSKQLVALDLCNVRSELAKGGDTIHIPRFTDPSVSTYTPGTTMSATAQDWAFDTLVVSAYKYAMNYIDDIHNIQSNVDAASELAKRQAYVLANQIDRDVLSTITGTEGFMPADNLDLGIGATNGAPVSAASGNIISVFAGAAAFLRAHNVEEVGDWCAVITPKVLAAVTVKAANVGFNVADSTLRNGYVGDFMDFRLYVSNNLPSGNLSAIAPAAGNGVIGGLSGGNASGTTPGRATYFGRKGTIDFAWQKMPSVEIKRKDDMLGSNYVTTVVYGKRVCKNNRERGINLSMPTAFTG